MAYVTPSGIIQLFKGINLDNRYMHTIYFASKTAQDTWFTSKYTAGISATPATAFGFTAQSYTRPTRGHLKVQKSPDDLLGVTYMRFKNRTKWFYAFVTATEYISETTTLISFEIDVMQTWFIRDNATDAENIKPCMVKRMHIPATDDVIGKHLESEPVGSEVYDMDKVTCKNHTTDATIEADFANTPYVIIQTSADPLNPPSGYVAQDLIQDGIFDGVWQYGQVLNTAGAQELYDFLYNAIGIYGQDTSKADILSIIQFPGYYHTHKDVTYDVSRPNSIGDYIPENKKLLCYPYSFLYLTSMDGDCAQYKWEYLINESVQDTGIHQFRLLASELGYGSMAIYPKYYNGVTENFDNKVNISNFPKCMASYDAYQAWVASGGSIKTEYYSNLAQQRGTIASEKNVLNTSLQLLTDAVSMGADLYKVTQGDALSGINAMNTAVGMIGKASNAYYTQKEIDITLDEAQHKRDFAFADARHEPNIVVGNQSPLLSMGYGLLGYQFFNVHVKKQEMIKIDDFLTVFGYAINKVEQPNLSSRPYWNFVQTEACEIGGNMPASSKQAIARIFDGGIFFWNNGDNVGNFECGGRTSGGALINKPR